MPGPINNSFYATLKEAWQLVNPNKPLSVLIKLHYIYIYIYTCKLVPICKATKIQHGSIQL